MTPERMAELVARWAGFYTRGLPASVARRRREEIEADLHDHIEHERARGLSDRRIARGILSRMVRGLAADASWRRQQAKAIPRRSPQRSATRVVLATAFILLIPLVAMQFSDEVVWTPADFIFAGVLLLGTGLTFVAASARTGNLSYRAGAGVALGAAFMLIWAVAAVGVIGEDGDPADLMYGGVLAVGVVGALIARFRPEGMARALLAMAIAQMIVAVIALIAGKHQVPITSIPELLGLNAFFAALFIASAWLFRRAARKHAPREP